MHLLAQQAGFSVTTHLMSPEGQVSFLPADSQEEVENQLHRLLDHVHLSLQKPVVVSLETSIAWLDLQDRFNPTGFESPEVETAMVKALEDDLRKSRFLHHHCGSLEHLWMEGEFLTLAAGLYGDFYQAVKHLKREKRS